MKRNNDRLLEGKLKPAMTLHEAAEVWAAVMNFGVSSIRYLAPRTLAHYKQNLKTICKHFGQCRLDTITHADLRKYQELRASGVLTDPNYKKRRNQPGPGAGANTINKETDLLIRLLLRSKAWTREMLESYVQLNPGLKDIPRAMSPAEQKRFLDVASSKKQWLLVYWYALLALRTCMSTQELRELHRADFNLEQRVVTVRAGSAKNQYRVRTIPLDHDAFRAARWLLDRAASFGALQPEHFVFPFRQRISKVYVPSRPMTQSGLQMQWDQVRRAADIPWLRLYDLRHTAITRYMEQGTPVAVVMEFAGHVSLKMNAHYTAISQQAKRMAADRMAAGATREAPDKSGNGADPSTGAGIKIPTLIANLKAAGMDSDSILQILQSSG